MARRKTGRKARSGKLTRAEKREVAKLEDVRGEDHGHLLRFYMLQGFSLDEAHTRALRRR